MRTRVYSEHDSLPFGERLGNLFNPDRPNLYWIAGDTPCVGEIRAISRTAGERLNPNPIVRHLLADLGKDILTTHVDMVREGLTLFMRAHMNVFVSGSLVAVAELAKSTGRGWHFVWRHDVSRDGCVTVWTRTDNGFLYRNSSVRIGDPEQDRWPALKIGVMGSHILEVDQLPLLAADKLARRQEKVEVTAVEQAS